MNRSWFSYLAVFMLLALLGLLATLQYRWLGQISDAESARLTKRLTDDTNRFARDFDSEIQKGFFALQINPSDLEKGELRGIQKRFSYWKQQSPDPGLIKSVYYAPISEAGGLKKIDFDKAVFVESGWPEEFSKVKAKIESSAASMFAIGNVLVMPLLGDGDDVRQIVVRRKTAVGNEVISEQEIGGAPERKGLLIFELDREVIRNKMIPRLVDKYFSRDGAGSFEVSVEDENGATLFATNGTKFVKGDASVRFFDLRPDEFAFFSEDIGNVKLHEQPVRKSTMILRETLKGPIAGNNGEKLLNVDLRGPQNGAPRISVFEGERGSQGGQWMLSVRHSAGSLDQFIANTRYRNLGISFGILAILAAGMVLIVIFSQRTRELAKRQLEFVSSVSHEFRTPLAVIYSAGENISDGVVEDRDKLVSYGELIKREGSKLTAMVEQVLEYAGANSGGRKYEFREDRIGDVIELALEECAPAIEEKGFEIERDIEEGLPPLLVDRTAMVQALQNLVANGLKYSNGSNWLRVSAHRDGGDVQISVEDRGIGIAPGDLKKVFEPFFRSKDVVDDQISGNGLGLSLVREIVNAHKGRVSVKSESGKGSVFTISIPMRG